MIVRMAIMISRSGHRDRPFSPRTNFDHDRTRTTDQDRSETLITMRQNTQGRGIVIVMPPHITRIRPTHTHCYSFRVLLTLFLVVARCLFGVTDLLKKRISRCNSFCNSSSVGK